MEQQQQGQVESRDWGRIRSYHKRQGQRQQAGEPGIQETCTKERAQACRPQRSRRRRSWRQRGRSPLVLVPVQEEPGREALLQLEQVLQGQVGIVDHVRAQVLGDSQDSDQEGPVADSLLRAGIQGAAEDTPLGGRDEEDTQDIAEEDNLER